MKRIATSAAAAITLAGAAGLFTTATAAAEIAVPDFAGEYAYVYTGGRGGFSTTWSVRPCGEACVHITTASGLTDVDARLAGGRWVFERYDEQGIACDNQQLMPATVRFSVDPRTLQGELQPLGTPCGGASRTTTFTLTRLG